MDPSSLLAPRWRLGGEPDCRVQVCPGSQTQSQRAASCEILKVAVRDTQVRTTGGEDSPPPSVPIVAVNAVRQLMASGAS